MHRVMVWKAEHLHDADITAYDASHPDAPRGSQAVAGHVNQPRQRRAWHPGGQWARKLMLTRNGEEPS